MKLPLSLELLSMSELAMDQGATAPPLRVAVTDATGERIDVSGATVRFRIDGREGSGRTLSDREEIEYHWAPEDTAEPGDYKCQFVIRPGGGDVLKAPSYSPATLSVHRSV